MNTIWVVFKTIFYFSFVVCFVVCLSASILDYRQRKYQRSFVIGAPDKSCARHHPEPN